MRPGPCVLPKSSHASYGGLVEIAAPERPGGDVATFGERTYRILCYGENEPPKIDGVTPARIETTVERHGNRHGWPSRSYKILEIL